MEFRVKVYTDIKPHIITGIIVLAALLVGAALVFWPKAVNTQTEFVIKDGQSLGVTARFLAERDLISSRYLFVGYAILLGKEKEFKAGRYLISSSVSIHRLVSIFSKGEFESDDVVVTIPEGSNIAEIGKIFAEASLINEDDFLNYFKNIGSWPEGELFPDTYRFKKLEPGENLDVVEIAQRMRENFRIKTGDLFEGRFTGEGGDNRGYRIISIASMLEKEVRTEEDMRFVAGIIEKRLSLGMSLELDATVAYGVCYPKFISGRYCDASLANIVDNIIIDSDYNTYSRVGLPKGPISNPGLRAIRAALNPQPSDYLFYLSAKDGTTIFSRTAAEHMKARQKYLNLK